MAVKKQRMLSGAVLVLAPTVSSSLAAIQELLKGVEVTVSIDGKPCTGYVHNLDFSKGSEHVFASVAVPAPEDEENTVYVRVSISKDGEVHIMPNQDED